MSRASEKFLRRVRRRLYASKQTKERMLGGLAAELSEAGGAGYAELVRLFGTPERVAEELQSSVNEAEAYAARTKARRVAILLAIVAVVLVITLAVFVWHVSNRSISFVDRNIIQDTSIILILTGAML